MYIWFFLLVSFLTLPVLGQGFSISKYYSPIDYELDDQNWDFIQDTTGRIYIANGRGVLMFDGSDWRSIEISKEARTTGLLLAKDSKIYLSGQFDFGLLYPDSLNNLKFESFRKKFSIDQENYEPSFSILEYENDIYFYNELGIYIYTSDGDIKVIKLENKGINSFFEFNNRLFALTNSNIYELIEEKFHHIMPLKYIDTTSVAVEYEDEIILASRFNGINRFLGDTLKNFNSNFEIEISEAIPINGIVFQDSLLAISTLEGVFFINRKGNLKNHLRVSSDSLLNYVPLSLFEDQEGSLWIGLWGGIQRFDTEKFYRHFGEISGLDSEVVDIIFYKNSLWLETYDEIKEIKKNKITNYDINGKIVVHKNRLFVYNITGIYLLNDSNEFEKKHSIEIYGHFKSIDDNINFITKNSILEMDDKTNLFYKYAFDNEQGNNIQGLVYKKNIFLLDKSDDIIYKYTDQGFQKIRILKVSETAHISLFELDIIENKLLLTSKGDQNNGGLYTYSEDVNMFLRDKMLYNRTPLNSNYQIQSIDQCNNGDIWLSDNDQIFRLKLRDIGYEIKSSPYQQIGGNKSILDIECDNNTVWIGGDNGLYEIFDPDWDYHTDFKTNITGIYVNNDSLIYGGFGEPVNPIVLPYEDNELRFTYAAASYIDETRNTYSVKLEGFDNDWSDWSLETQKDYTNIPEGDYIFKVRSKNVFEVDGREDQILFSVLPPWYRTWWAYLLYIIGFSGLMYSGHRIRLNQLLKVERMRTKIASDLHDEVSATLTGISYFAEAVKTDQNEEKKSHFINLITESAGDAKEKITDIVWSITPENDDWTIFLSKCRRYASDLLESSGMEYTLNITDQIPGKLKMNTRQHLWMIFKEILTNAVRHSAGKRIDLILDVEDGILKLIVQDDGKGFDISSKSFGNGLNNIRKRSEEIGATLELDSELEMGSRWRLELKL